MWRIVAASVSVCLIVVGAWIYREGSQPVFTFDWEPLSRPFEAKPGFEVVAPFHVGLADEYAVAIDFLPPADRRPIVQGQFTEQIAAVDLLWSVASDGTVIAAGESMSYPDNWFGGERQGRDVGVFHGEPGRAYVFRATVRNGAAALNASAPRLRIVLNTNRMTDYGYALEFQPYIRRAGGMLVAAGILLLGVAIALAARAWRRTA